MSPGVARVAAALLALLAAAVPARPATPTEHAGNSVSASGREREWTEVKLLPSGASPSDHVGQYVAIEDGRLLVTSDEFGDSSGAVYVFERIRGVWREVGKITGSDEIVPDDFFGIRASLSGDTIVVSAPEQDDVGVEHVFERIGGTIGWREVRELRSPDGEATRFAGSALDGDTLLVGSAYDDDMGLNAGAIYVFGRDVGGEDRWGPVAKLFASDAGPSDYFGTPSAIDGDTFIAASEWDDDVGSDTGAVYVFDRDPVSGDWQEVAKLVAADGEDNDHFGGAPGLSGNTVVVGVDGRDSELGNNVGVAYVFDRDTGGPDQWGEVARLTASDGGHGHNFGSSVGIDGGRMAIGARFAPGIEERVGAVYVFERQPPSGEWLEVAKLFASDGEGGDGFAYAVASASGTVVVGAEGDDDAGFNAGGVYVYEIQPLLTVAGSCPGVIDLEIVDAAPDVPVVLLGAESEGTDTVPVGPCAGADVDLSGPRIVGTFTADEEGRVSLSRSVGPGVCGEVLQGLETWTCRVSTTARVPGGE